MWRECYLKMKWTSVKISQSRQVQIGIIHLLIRFQAMKFMKKIHHSRLSRILFNIKDVRTELRWNPNNLIRTPFPYHIIYNALHGHYYPQFRSSAEIADNSIRLVNKLQAKKTLPFCRDSNEIRFICKQKPLVPLVRLKINHRGAEKHNEAMFRYPQKLYRWTRGHLRYVRALPPAQKRLLPLWRVIAGVTRGGRCFFTNAQQTPNQGSKPVQWDKAFTWNPTLVGRRQGSGP